MYTELGMQSETANLYTNLGELYDDLNNLDSAIFYFNNAIQILEIIGENEKYEKSLYGLSKLYAKKGNYKMAYYNQFKYSRLRDSLINNIKIATLSEMQTRFETEIKEQKIELLSEQNANKTQQRNGLITGSFVLIALLIAVNNQRNKAKNEKLRSESLLLNILPEEVANELKANGSSEAKLYNNVTVLFTDFVDFTKISGEMNPKELVNEIDINFTAFDAIIEKFGLEKIKTIGDAYLAVCGLPNELETHAFNVVNAAIEICELMDKNNSKFKVRIGINSGPVVAGIVGVKKFQYDIWGDTVNTASRVESNGASGKVNISNSTYNLIKNIPNFTFESRGAIEAKGKGEIEMWFVSKNK